MCTVDVTEIPGGQVGFEGNLHGCLKGARGSLLTLFWELVIFIGLPNHPGWWGPWEVCSANSCLKSGSAESRPSCSRHCWRKVTPQLLWANLFQCLFILTGKIIFFYTQCERLQFRYMTTVSHSSARHLHKDPGSTCSVTSLQVWEGAVRSPPNPLFFRVNEPSSLSLPSQG